MIQIEKYIAGTRTKHPTGYTLLSAVFFIQFYWNFIVTKK